MTQPLDLLDDIIERYQQVKRKARTDLLTAAEKAKAEAEKKEAEAETKPVAE